VSLIREEGKILEESHEAEGTRLVALVEDECLWKLRKILGIRIEDNEES